MTHTAHKLETAKYFKSKSGRECYLSGVKRENNIWTATIRFTDTMEFKQVPFNIIEKYL